MIGINEPLALTAPPSLSGGPNARLSCERRSGPLSCAARQLQAIVGRLIPYSATASSTAVAALASELLYTCTIRVSNHRATSESGRGPLSGQKHCHITVGTDVAV